MLLRITLFFSFIYLFIWVLFWFCFWRAAGKHLYDNHHDKGAGTCGDPNLQDCTGGTGAGFVTQHIDVQGKAHALCTGNTQCCDGFELKDKPAATTTTLPTGTGGNGGTGATGATDPVTTATPTTTATPDPCKTRNSGNGVCKDATVYTCSSTWQATYQSGPPSTPHPQPYCPGMASTYQCCTSGTTTLMGDCQQRNGGVGQCVDTRRYVALSVVLSVLLCCAAMGCHWTLHTLFLRGIYHLHDAVGRT